MGRNATNQIRVRKDKINLNFNQEKCEIKKSLKKDI